MSELSPIAPGGESDLRTVAAELAGFAEFAAIVRRHIDKACSTTQDAGMDILSRLSGIEAAMHEMLDYVSASVTSGPAFAAVEKTQRGMNESLALIARLAQQREASATAAADQLAEVKAIGLGMTEMVRDIQRIAKQTYYLSINAGIEAVRAGPEGDGLSVVAREVRELSRRTDTVAKEIGRGIGQLEATIWETLRVVVEERDTRERASFSELAATFEGVSAHLARVVDHQNALLDRIHRDSEAMVAPVMSLAASIQFQDITRQQLEQVGRSMTLVAEHYARLGKALASGSPPPPGSLGECLQQMHDGYVMDRQRTSHTGQDDNGKMPAIELF